MNQIEKEKIDIFETELAILKESGKIKGYVLAILPEEDGNPLIAANATTLEIFGLSEAIKQYHILTTKSDCT
jgi:hypothetical protein